MFNNIKVELFDFQKVVVQQMLAHHYIINASQMGTGKSLEALATQQEVGGTCLIICPAYLRSNWKDEYEKFCRKVPDIKILKTTKQVKECQGFEIAIISYSAIQYAAHLFKRAKCIIVDESHYLKNHQAKRTQHFVANVAERPPNRLMMLSGTPIKNRVEEFYTQLNLTKYNPFGTYGVKFTFASYYTFAAHFCYSSKMELYGATITKYFGMKKETLPQLKRLLKCKYIRVRAEDVLKDLPDLIHKEIVVDVKEGKLEKEWLEFEKRPVGHASTAKAESALLKAKHTADYVNDILDTGEPVVVFTDHLGSLGYLSNKIKGTKGVISGSVTADKRHQIVKDFQEGKINCIISTIGAGSTGFTLTRSKNLVFNDFSWVPGDNDQAMKRIHRIGQTRGAVIHWILAGPIDKQILKTLKEKQKILTNVLEG